MAWHSAGTYRVVDGRIAGNCAFESMGVKLIGFAGGHTFGKTHGAASASNLEPNPESVPISEQGLGWNKVMNADRFDMECTKNRIFVIVRSP